MRCPEVSMVMSVFNGAGKLSDSIESVLSQKGIDFELIIVDDGSIDETPEIIRKYAADDRRVRTIRQENLGLTQALIRGCYEAKGKFIARQDNGDCSRPGRLKSQADLLSLHTGMVIAVGWIRQVIAGDVVGTVRLPFSSDLLTRKLREEMKGIPAHGCAMFRRDAYLKAGGYRKEFFYAQDCDLWLRLAPLGKLGCVQNFVYDLNMVADGISSSRQKMQRTFCDFAQRAYGDRQKGKDDEYWVAKARKLRLKALAERKRKPGRYGLASAHYWLGTMVEKRDKANARKHYIRALKTCPLYWRAWAKLF